MKVVSMIEQQPWQELPRLLEFPSLAELTAQPIYQTPPRGAGGNRAKRRTSSIGRDRLGRSFRRGDQLQAIVSGTLEFVKVDEIFLDDTEGQPYGSVGYWNWLFFLHQASGELFKESRGPNNQSVLVPLDMDWRGTHLGLIEATSFPYYVTIPAGFTPIKFQDFKVRCIPLETANARKLTLDPDNLSVLEAPLPVSELQLYREARKMPLDQSRAFPTPK